VSPVTEDEDGIIPRAVRQMFDILSVSDKVAKRSWQREVVGQFKPSFIIEIPHHKLK